MSEEIRQKLSLDAEDAVRDANKVADSVERIGVGAREAGAAGKKAGDDIASGLRKAERESEQLSKSLEGYERQNIKVRQQLLNVREAQKEAGKGTQEFNKLEKQAEKYSRQLKENAQDAKKLRLDKKIVDGNIRDLKKQEKQLERNRKETERASKSTSKFGKVLQNVGRFLVAAFAVDRIIAGIRSTVRTIEEYQSAVSELRGISQATDEQIKSLTSTAREFAKASRFTATEVVKAQTELAKLGRTVDEINATTESVLLLATAAGTDVANAAEVAAQTMNQFGITTEESGRVTDILARSFTSSALTIERFQGAFKAVGTTASVVGASLEETTANISALVDAGIPAEKAGTDLRNIYIALAEEGITWAEAQDRLLNSSDKLTTATDLFGRRAGAAGVIIAQNADKIADLTEAYENSAGAAQDLADAQLDNLRGDKLLLTSAWEEFILSVEEGAGVIASFGRGFTQALTAIVKGLTESKDAIGDLTTEIQNLDEESSYFERLLVGFGAYLRRFQIAEQATSDNNEAVEDAISLAKQLTETEKEANKVKEETVKLTEQELAAQRELTAQKTQIRVLEQERNNAIINDNLEAEKKALEEVNAAMEEAGEVDIRRRESNNARIREINQELLKSDLKLARIREDAKQAEIALLQSIENKTPQIQAQIIQAQTDLVGLSRAVDDLLVKLATGASENILGSPELAPDQDFAEGILPTLETVEESVIGMNERLQTSYEDLAKRAVEIYQDQANAGISLQMAYEMAVKESEGVIYRNRVATAQATITAYGQVFSALANIATGAAQDSREYAVFQIATQTAISLANAIAGATAAGANTGVAAPISTPLFIAQLVGIALSGIAQAKAALAPAPTFSAPSYEGGGATTSTARSGGVDGKGGFNAILHPSEIVVDETKPQKGLKALFSSPKISTDLNDWISNYSIDSRLDNLMVVQTIDNTSKTSNSWSDKRMVNRLSKSLDLQAQTVDELRRLGKSRKFKRAG